MAVVLLLAVGSLAAVMGLFHLPIFTAAWAHDTAASVTRPGTAVVLRVDTDTPLITRLVDDAVPSLPRGAVDPYMPYEAAVGLSMDHDTGMMQVVMAASLRRVADVWARLGNDSGALQIPGATAWQPAGVDAGLWLREGQLSPPADWQPPLPAAAPVRLPPCAGRHAVEVVLDNRGGRAAAVLTPVLWALPLPETIALDGPAALYTLLDGLESGTARLDFEDRDTLRVQGSFHMHDAAAAGRLARALDAAVAGWAPEWAARAAELDLNVQVLRGNVSVSGTASGVRRPLIAWLQGIAP